MTDIKFLYAILALAIVLTSHGAPLEKEQCEELDPELTPGFFEGDMILDPTRNGIRNEVRLWPNNTIYYRFYEDHFDSEHTDHILAAMRKIEAVSCIRFVEAGLNQEMYVNITSMSGGCYSSVGFLNRVQSLNLNTFPIDQGCFRMGVIIHEIFHTIGFYHMQGSSDRDDFVQIVEENIRDGTQHNFKKMQEHQVDTFDEEYDYGSIMHYGPKAFSKNGKNTIVALKNTPAAKQMGQRREMSKSDINKLNTMYRCPLKA